MAGLNDLFESIISMGATLGGKAIEQSGKHGVMSVARKIGWASKNGSSGKRLQNHKMANGFNRSVAGGRLGEYDLSSQYKSAMLSGSGLGRKLVEEKQMPEKLFGRSSFQIEENKFSSQKVGSSRQQCPVTGLLKRTKF